MSASFTGPDGLDPVASMKYFVKAMSTPTVGDQLLVGQMMRSRVRQRTSQGVNCDGVPFIPYSSKGPFYLYPNRDSARGDRSARATAAAGRHSRTGKGGKRTPLGIKYASYGSAKAAHGVSVVNEYGLEQHTHMLDVILVKAGAIEDGMAGFDVFETASIGGGNAMLATVSDELSEFSHTEQCAEVSFGFYGPEAERAKGQNEGNSKTPKRDFFRINEQDLQDAALVISHRMWLRSKHPNKGGSF